MDGSRNVGEAKAFLCWKDVLLLIRLEVQLCLSVALADVTRCDLGIGEQWAKAGTISLMQTHSQPCYILLPGVSHQFPLDPCEGDWKTWKHEFVC